MKKFGRKLVSVILSAAMFIGQAVTLTAYADAGTAELTEKAAVSDTGGFELHTGLAPVNTVQLTPEETAQANAALDKLYEGAFIEYRHDILYGKSYGSRYFYDQLSSDEKALYDGMYEEAKKFAASTTDLAPTRTSSGDSYLLPGVQYVNGTDTRKVMQVFFNENPCFFFLVNGGASGYETYGSTTTYYYYLGVIDDFAKASKRKSYKSKIDKTASAIIEGANAVTAGTGKTIQQAKVDYIAEAIINRVIYDLNAPYNQTIASSLGNDKSVCSGYAMAMSYLCNAVGVRCIELVSEEHAWNVVNLGTNEDPNWKYIDVTWMDQEENGIWEIWRYVDGSTKMLNLERSQPNSNNSSNHLVKASVYTGLNIPGYNGYGTNVAYNEETKNPDPGDDDTDISDDDEDPDDDDPVGVSAVVWANGGKDKASGTNYKTAQLTPKTVTSATEWTTTVKGKIKKTNGKLAWLVSKTQTAPSYDVTKHKLTTKTDKTIASVSNKGVVSAVSGGSTGEQTAYVYVTDSGSMKSEVFAVTVKNAANTVFCTTEAASSNKKDAAKTVALNAGESTEIYINALAKGKNDKVSADNTYTVTPDAKNDGYISVSDVASSASGDKYFTVTALKSNGNKAAKVKVTVTNVQSGKKGTFSVSVSSPINSVRPSISGSETALQEKGGKAEVSLEYDLEGECTDTTWKLKAFAATNTPTIDSKKKVVFTKSKSLSVSLKNNVITLKSSKGTKEEQTIYLQATDTVTKEITIFPVAHINSEGVLVTVEH